MRTGDWAMLAAAFAGGLAAGCAPQPGPEVEPRMIGHYENAGRLYAEAAAGRLDGVRTEARELLAGLGFPFRAS